MKTTLFPKTSQPFVLITLILLASCSTEEEKAEQPKEKPVTVLLSTASNQSAGILLFSGKIESKQTVFISTRMMGVITAIHVKPGDRVQKGQLLVVIQSNDILAKRAQGEAMIAEAEAALADAEKDYQRFTALHQQQSASTKEFEIAALRYSSAKAKVDAARQIKNETDAMLTYANLVAPFTGVITLKHADEGSLSSPGMPILTMEQFGSYEVSTSVSESDVGKLKVGMIADVTIKSIGKTFSGKISEISPSAQFTGGQFPVKVTVPTTEKDGILSGMHATVSVPIESDVTAGSLFVPSSAIVHKDQLSGLYTIGENKTAQLRWLKTGRKLGDQVEILSGLQPGEKFIMHSESKLYSGVSVLVK